MSFELLSPVWTHLTDIVVERAEGAYLYDAQGRRYLDFTCGIGVTNTGHCHPTVVRAIQEQAAKLIFGQMNCVIAPPALALAEALNRLTPPSIDRFFFSNSGAEITEAAVKLAKMATGKPNIIVFNGSFHGRTHLTMGLTGSKTVYRAHYQPLPSGIFFAPFPYAYRYGWDEDQTVDFCLQQLEYLLHSQSAPQETGLVLIEPVLGEGGYVPAAPRFLQELRRLCSQHDILLGIDEVQSGFGRTGSFWAYESSGITPDLLLMAKGLGSGMPISALGASQTLMERWLPGSHGGTYGGGNAVVMAAAVATIEAIQADNMVENARLMGDYLCGQLQALQQDFPFLGDVRGRGLMIGTEFATDGGPNAALAKETARVCLEEGLLLLTCGTYGNVIRWIPPLIVTRTQLDEALAIFRHGLESVAALH